jgi:gamma-tubulin complex component 3
MNDMSALTTIFSDEVMVVF